MLSGRRLDLLDPSPFDIEIEDIAHGLARVARWNGQTIGEHAFSVAQHSCVVEEIAAHIRPGLDPKWRLAALLHDASEYVIGDMISPFKAVIGDSYKDVEHRILGLCFGLRQLGLQLLVLLVELLECSLLHQQRLGHVVRRRGLTCQMLIDPCLGQGIARGRSCLGLLQPCKQPVNQGLLFAVHDNLIRLQIKTCPWHNAEAQ